MKEGNPGMNKMANVLGGMMSQVAEKPLTLDFGIINKDYSLTTNHFPCPIPKDKYSVNRSLTYDPIEALTVTYPAGQHVHMHHIKLPKKMHWIKPGDKVIVGWIDNEAVVLCVVYNAKPIGDKEPNYY